MRSVRALGLSIGWSVLAFASHALADDTTRTGKQGDEPSVQAATVSEARTTAAKNDHDRKRVASLRKELAKWEARIKDRLESAETVTLAEAGPPELGSPTRIVRVGGSNHLPWPEDTRVQYILFLDERRRIRFVREVPVSYTGDWYVEDERLFDGDGRTLAFARRLSFFGIECSDFEIPKPAREVFTVYLDGPRTIAKDYRMTDRNDVPVDLKQCSFIEFPLELDLTAAEYLKRNGLEAAARSAGIHR